MTKRSQLSLPARYAKRRRFCPMVPAARYHPTVQYADEPSCGILIAARHTPSATTPPIISNALTEHFGASTEKEDQLPHSRGDHTGTTIPVYSFRLFSFLRKAKSDPQHYTTTGKGYFVKRVTQSNIKFITLSI